MDQVELIANVLRKNANKLYDRYTYYCGTYEIFEEIAQEISKAIVAGKARIDEKDDDPDLDDWLTEEGSFF